MENSLSVNQVRMTKWLLRVRLSSPERNGSPLANSLVAQEPDVGNKPQWSSPCLALGLGIGLALPFGKKSRLLRPN